MAKVTAPFLSLGATGQFGKTLVASTWKGLNTMRQYVVPANPQTAAQVAQRALLTAAVYSFRNYFTATALRTAWNVSAALDSRPLSGANLAIGAMILLGATDPDASLVSAVTPGVGTMNFAMQNMDHFAMGDEAGNFEVWAGYTKSSLRKLSEETIGAGAIISTSIFYATGTTIYMQIRKGGVNRSGVLVAVAA